MKEHVRDNIKIVPAFNGEAKINKYIQAKERQNDSNFLFYLPALFSFS